MHKPAHFPCIPIARVIPDILHLFLRILDVLTNLLISELRRLDGIDKVNAKVTGINHPVREVFD